MSAGISRKAAWCSRTCWSNPIPHGARTDRRFNAIRRGSVCHGERPDSHIASACLQHCQRGSSKPFAGFCFRRSLDTATPTPRSTRWRPSATPGEFGPPFPKLMQRLLTAMFRVGIRAAEPKLNSNLALRCITRWPCRSNGAATTVATVPRPCAAAGRQAVAPGSSRLPASSAAVDASTRLTTSLPRTWPAALSWSAPLVSANSKDLVGGSLRAPFCRNSSS